MRPVTSGGGWKAIGYTLKMANADSDAMKWAVVCGTSFIKHYWDPRAGDMWEEPTPIQPALTTGKKVYNFQIC